MRRSTLLIPLALFALALVIRLPYLAAIPAPTDETDELLLALEILGGARPLTANDAYLGPWPVYLTAGAYTLLGPSLFAGRLVAALLGALIAPATWALGRSLGGGRAGLAAGLLAAASFGPVLLSHVAWGHGAAPALAALALVGLVGVARIPTLGRGLATGVLAGLAMGLHPTVLALLPGAFVWWLATGAGTRTERVRAGLAMVAGLLLGNATNLLFVALNGFGPLAERLAERGDYVGTGLRGWLGGIPAWLDGLARNLAGPAAANIVDPRLWLGVALLGGGLWFAARRGHWLPAAVVLSSALLMPLMVAGDKYVSLTGLRYPAVALPAALAAVGLGIDRWMLHRGVADHWRGWAPVAVLLLIQLASLGAFYADVSARGVTASPVLAVTEGLSAAALDGHTVFVDQALDTKLTGGGEVGRAVRAFLRLAGTEFTVAKADKMRWFLENGDGATYDLVLAGDTADALGSEFPLVVLREVPVLPDQVSRSGGRWGWYRLQSDGGSSP